MLDKRGSGLSTRELGSGSPEDRMDDVRAVMDAVGSRRAALLGQHDGGPIAMLFAATYPERVSALVLINTSARRRADRDYEGPTPEELEGAASAFEESWGTGRSIFPVVSDVPDAEAALELLAVIERSIGTPRSVGRQARLAFAFDVRSALPLIEAPTLICRLELSVVPPVQMRYLAEHIRGARYVEGFASLSRSWDFAKQDPALDTIEEFLTGQRPTPTVDIERVLATVLFTDIVDSTRRVAELGDRRWREMLDAHDARCTAEVDRFRGRVVKQTGDGLLATFDGPARAIRCAQAIVAAAHGLGLAVRAGLHTGEVEMRGSDVSGLAVHIGARISALAG